MNRTVRALLAALIAVGALVLLAAPAGAHASLSSSEPAGGAALRDAPKSIKITFTEPPDPALSSIKVTGKSGPVKAGAAKKVAGDPLSLTLPLPALDKGSYNVTWRTVSQADGHSSSGAFNFGVAEPPEIAAPAPPAPTFSPPGAAGRWIFDLGLMGLVGAACAVLFVFRDAGPGLLRFARRSWLVAVAGLLILGASQLIDSEAGLGVFLGSSSGGALLHRGLPLAVAGLGFLLFRSNPRRAAALAGIAGLAAMFAHAAAGHAAVDPSRWLKIAVQTIHLGSVGVWIGGLAALLVGIRGEPGEAKAAWIRRFSTLAGVSIFTVAATGVLRAVNEVGSWGALFDNRYGKLVVAKVVLIGVLGLLGARNRFRNVPQAESSTGGLVKTSRYEIAVAVVTLAVAGVLASSIPPISQAAAADNGPIVARGNNFAATLKAELTVSPGTAGPNRFSIVLTDAGGGPVDLEDPSLRFASLSNPELGASNLPLEKKTAGKYEAVGDSLSIDGRWRINLAGRRGTDSVDIPLELSTRAAGYQVEKLAAEGQPTIYKITDGQGRQLQVYLDPEKPGRSEFHVTLFGADGVELPVDSVVVTAVPPKGTSTNLATRRFGPGHFVSDVDLAAGKYQFDVVASTAGGRIRFLPELEVEK